MYNARNCTIRWQCTRRRADEMMVKVKVLTSDVDMWTVVVLNWKGGDNRRHCSNLRIIV